MRIRSGLFVELSVRAILFAFVLTVVLPSVSVVRADEQPNLLVILADDLGYGDLACCGASDMQTPHLDRLFASGMRFTNFYANCPVCSPTRAALLSGRYQELVGVPGVIRTHSENSWGYLDPNATLLPKVARQHGYHTAIIGKWHLGLSEPNRPNDRGFDLFRGFLGDMMDDYYNHRRHGVNYMYYNRQEIDPAGHATDLFSDWAIEYVKERQSKQEPFLLYLAYNAPHTPIQPPADWEQKVLRREADIDPARAKLVALIEHMDAGIGRVLAALEESGQTENTIVVFTSDNGGQLNVGANNGPLRDGKQSMYEGGLKVPTVVSWPNQIKAGSTTPFRAMSMDILPTLFDYANIPQPDGIEGRSFRPTLSGETQPALRGQMFFCRREGGLRYGGETIEAVIEGPWKLLQNSPWEPLELYNIDEDPQEQTNLFEKERRIVNRLGAALRRQIQRGGAVPWQRSDLKP
ncbi:MAG: sulfatase-like hydrolase/transferase [Fuerstiella sp.]